MAKHCKELESVTHGRSLPTTPRTHGCEECLAEGGKWVHLRLCLSCGHVGCCDNSPGRHATGHFHKTSHPVIKSFEPDENWAYCYEHDDMVDEIPAFSVESPSMHYSAPAF